MKFSVNRSALILFVALAMGGAAAFGVNRYIQRQVQDIEERGKLHKTVKVIVPRSDMPKGAVIAPDTVAVREIPEEWVHSNAITPDQFDRVAHQKLAYPALRGETILWSLLEGQRAPSFSSRLASGHRAITVPVDEVNSISGMIEPGDRIDLMAWVRKDNKTFMFPLLQNALILATGSRTVVDADDKGGRRTYTTITLDATPGEAQRVLAARELGKIAALLRAPGDVAKNSDAQMDANTLLGLNEERPLTGLAHVPVLYGGHGTSGAQAPLRPPAEATPR
jgi:pilus assembly protein CpaB